MARILAIEPNPECGVTLRQFVRESLGAELVLATSAEAAIAAMSDEPPDLILTSTLLGPGEDQQLAAHLRQQPSLRHMPILTIPPLVDQEQDKPSRGLLSRLMGRQHRRWSAYDFEAVAGRIRESIDAARLAAAEDRAMTSRCDVVEAPAAALEMSDEELRAYCGLGSKRKRARRWSGDELPWISSVKLSWGLELRLLNISRSGVLVESGIRLTPGNRTQIQLGGPHSDLVVAARVVRSRVSTVDPLGVRYVSAAQFEQSFDALSPGDTSVGVTPDPDKHLAELVARIRAGADAGERPEELRAEFEAGVGELVTAQEIRLRDIPVVENDGRDSVYFTIPTADRSPAILQVTFEANYRPRAEEFTTLRAASVAAAEVLSVTDTSRQLTLAVA